MKTKIKDFNAQDTVDAKLLENSIHLLAGEICEEKISAVIKWIIFENVDNTEKTLTLYINSTGGDLYSAFALIDVMKSSKHPVRTIGIGAIMSAAFLIFSAGTHGQRYAAANTSFMCHQFSESMESKFHDLKATMKGNELCNSSMVDILTHATGLTASVVKKKLLCASDVYLSAAEAIELGIADHLL